MTLYITGKAILWGLFVLIVGLIGCFYLLKNLILAFKLIVKYLDGKGRESLPEAVNILVSTIRICLLVALIIVVISYIF